MYSGSSERRTARAALVAFGLICVLGPSLAPYDPLREVGPSLALPSVEHLLGTDLIGRDIFSRLLHGGWRTAGTAVIAMLVALLPGIVIGVSAGWFGGPVDRITVILIDALSAIPGLLTALCVVTLIGGGPLQVALAVGISGFPSAARLSRAAARSVRGQLYVVASRAAGAGHFYLIRCCILLNAAPALISAASVLLAWSLLNAATLYFLGFGGDPALPEWGAMLADARSVIRVAPHVAFAPGLALMGLLASMIAAGE